MCTDPAAYSALCPVATQPDLYSDYPCEKARDPARHQEGTQPRRHTGRVQRAHNDTGRTDEGIRMIPTKETRPA